MTDHPVSPPATIAECLVALNWSGLMLADELGVDPTQVKRWLNDPARHIMPTHEWAWLQGRALHALENPAPRRKPRDQSVPPRQVRRTWGSKRWAALGAEQDGEPAATA